MGRPSSFTQETADAICDRIADGESLRAICLADDMPNKATVFKWLAANKDFSDQYTRARETQADALFDEILDIADSQEGDVYIKDGVELVNHDVIARAKLRIDSRKWMAGKMRPKVYGEKVTNELVGSNGGPIEVNVGLDVSKLSTATLAELMAAKGEDTTGD